jgi:23S rRNA (uracil1939-C5)-methyltransferase
MPEDFLNCSYASICSGCGWLLKPAPEQQALKLAHLKNALKDLPKPPPPIEFNSCGLGSSRDRVDLMIDQRSGPYRLGLFDRFRTGIVDLQGCPQLSPRLENWLQEFRRIEFPISRGSVRLRVAPDGSRGAWLDFANVDVKSLLDERVVLEKLVATGAVIEIGQRRKRLVFRDDRFRLDDPVLAPWFETYADGREIPLYATIGSFTQPGFAANRILVETAMAMATKAGSKSDARAAEFGSGIGNFTLPLSSQFSKVDAYEVDVLALEGLERSLREQHRSNVEIHSGNFQGEKALALNLSGVEVLLVDPPRSGLMKFTEPLVKSKPRSVVYVSCFAESFAADTGRLIESGYNLNALTIVDQFPQSRHYEIVAHFN